MFVGEAAVPAGRRIYAIGDIHGCINPLNNLIAAIDADLMAHPVTSHTIIAVGDYCDRGPDTAAVLDRLIALSEERDIVALLGNHDVGVLDFLQDPLAHAPTFFAYGGLQTLMSYGVSIDARHDPIVMARDLNRAMPRTHRRFIEELPMSHEAGDYLFVHAGVNPDIALDAQRASDLLWIRKPFLNHSGDFGRVVVHGHTPVHETDIRKNRINVDTSAVFGGLLSCAVLEGQELRVLSVPGEG